MDETEKTAAHHKGNNYLQDALRIPVVNFLFVLYGFVVSEPHLLGNAVIAYETKLKTNKQKSS